MIKATWTLPLALCLAGAGFAAAETPLLTSDDAFIRTIADGQGSLLIRVQATAAPADLPLTTELKYAGRSLEHAATIRHIYDLATIQVLPMLARQAGDWAIVLDVDETVLSNYGYQELVVKTGCGFQTSTWDAWIRSQAAVAIAPAKDFLDTVRAFIKAHPKPQGRIVFITDRSPAQEKDTVENLRKTGLFFDGDLMLTRVRTPKGQPLDTKDVRRSCVEKGNTGSDARCQTFVPAEIVATFGDSFRDHFEYYGNDALTKGREALDQCMAKFKCYVIPNPMYGQWDDQGAAGPYERFKPTAVQTPKPAHCQAN